MIKVYSFNEFINEGILFSRLKKLITEEDDDLADIIIAHLNKYFNPKNLEFDIKWIYSSIKYIEPDDVFKYKYLIKPRPKNQDIDPYGEEDWGSGKDADTIILASKRRDGDDKTLILNGVPLVVSDRKFNKIWDILEAPRIERERLKKKEKERQLKLKNEKTNKKHLSIHKLEQEIIKRKKKLEFRKKLEF
jgi:hypothetical protein